MNIASHAFELIQVFDTYDGLLPIFYHVMIWKRVMSSNINHGNALDLSDTIIDITYKNSAKSTMRWAGIKMRAFFNI